MLRRKDPLEGVSLVTQSPPGLTISVDGFEHRT
jgi:hypothetical protein